VISGRYPFQAIRKPFIVVQTEFDENWPRVSPDGRWVAYHSNEGGRDEVYVQPFSGRGRNWQISTNGGAIPQWRRDGQEIFYFAPDNRMMAVPVTLDTQRLTVDAGTPIPLFSVRRPPGQNINYDATPDGQRFLINTPAENATVAPITVVLNWKARQADLKGPPLRMMILRSS
jgi:Tol biopolymer transport system component